MAILRERKKKIILAASVGFATGILPAGLLAAYIGTKYQLVKSEYDRNKELYMPYEQYVLTSDLKRGDVVEEDDIEKVVFYSEKEVEKTDREDILGMVLKQEVKNGIIITPSMLYEDKGISDDLRTYYFDYINVPLNVTDTDVFDIRISFPNGEDYIVATAKTLDGRNEEGVFISATEEELLKISSAHVDASIYEGAKIYASVYVTDYQKEPVVNYPVNMYVTKMSDWNPNLLEKITKEADVYKRTSLENNLYDFMGISIGNTYVGN